MGPLGAIDIKVLKDLKSVPKGPRENARTPDEFEGRHRGSILHAREYAGCLKEAPL